MTTFDAGDLNFSVVLKKQNRHKLDDVLQYNYNKTKISLSLIASKPLHIFCTFKYYYYRFIQLNVITPLPPCSLTSCKQTPNVCNHLDFAFLGGHLHYQKQTKMHVKNHGKKNAFFLHDFHMIFTLFSHVFHMFTLHAWEI